MDFIHMTDLRVYKEWGKMSQGKLIVVSIQMSSAHKADIIHNLHYILLRSQGMRYTFDH